MLVKSLLHFPTLQLLSWLLKSNETYTLQGEDEGVARKDTCNKPIIVESIIIRHSIERGAWTSTVHINPLYTKLINSYIEHDYVVNKLLNVSDKLFCACTMIV